MTAFKGRILNTGNGGLVTSAFKKTGWDTDTPTLPAQTPMAFKKTDWDTDNDNAEPRVIGFQSTTDNWA